MANIETPEGYAEFSRTLPQQLLERTKKGELKWESAGINRVRTSDKDLVYDVIYAGNSTGSISISAPVPQGQPQSVTFDTEYTPEAAVLYRVCVVGILGIKAQNKV
jgi:hypothetical protein